MFRHLRVKSQPHKVAPDPGELSLQRLVGDFTLPISIRALNGLPDNARQRIYHNLIPPSLLTRLNINPINWLSAGGEQQVQVTAAPDSGMVTVSVRQATSPDACFFLELADNSLNGIDLNMLLLNDPVSPRFGTDFDDHGVSTQFGAARRNLAEEARAIQAGLAPGQIRSSLGASALVFQQLDAFLAFAAHQAVFLEPLTYASAWVFERRDFAYVRGHRLMDEIHREFQPGGRLHQALDGSTSFRQPGQWQTVRGRAWAIHDGILDVLEQRWNGLRMVKQVGRHAGVSTFPDAIY